MMQTAEITLDNAERYRDLGCAIAYYRKRKGMAQEQVAEKVGISRQHMGAIEAPNMVRAVSLDVLFNIAAVLEIEPYKLLKFSPEKQVLQMQNPVHRIGEPGDIHSK